jgi:hypothetical protein
MVRPPGPSNSRRPFVSERLRRPHDGLICERDQDAAVVVGYDEGELDLGRPPLIPGADHLLGSRCVPPPRSHQCRPDRVVILAPRRDINVVVLTGYRAYPEIDRPAAEQPVLDSMLVEGAAQAGDRR